MIDHENENIWKILNHFWSSRPGSTILSCPIFRPPPFFTILHPEIFPRRRAYLADELIPPQNAGKSDSELSNIVLKRQSNHNLPSFNELAIYQSHGCHTDDLMKKKKLSPNQKKLFLHNCFLQKTNSKAHFLFQLIWSQTTCSVYYMYIPAQTTCSCYREPVSGQMGQLAGAWSRFKCKAPFTVYKAIQPIKAAPQRFSPDISFFEFSQ